MTSAAGLWVLFGLGILGMLALDLGLLHKRAHEISWREAAFWCLVWFALAMFFAGAVYGVHGREKAMQFIAGYLLEQSLSVDNMFVFVMIFHYFAIPPLYQSRILHWGILGAIAMRFLFIFAGIGLLKAFHWMIYVFGALLIFTGAKMAFQEDRHEDPGKNPVLLFFKKFMPFTDEYRGQEFFARLGGGLCATPLFAALLVVEFSDIIFAIDSVPAVIAVTKDPFIVYTSNVFAIMGLRALYFLLARLVGLFRYLRLGISVILCFVGVKMLSEGYYEIPVGVSLGVIAGVIGVSVLASLIAASRDKTLRASGTS